MMMVGEKEEMKKVKRQRKVERKRMENEKN